MNAVFLDTIGLIAVWDKADQWHAQAESVYHSLVNAREHFVTSSWIFLECGKAAARRPYRNRVNALRQTMMARGEVYEPSASQIEQAWQDYDAKSAAGAGIVDLVSFLIMRQIGNPARVHQ